jgi:hypothetical protein
MPSVTIILGMWIWIGVGAGVLVCGALLLGLVVAASLEAMAEGISETDVESAVELAPKSVIGL